MEKSRSVVLIAMAAIIAASAALAGPVGTGYTYQGRLLQSGKVADGEFDFVFELFDDPNTAIGVLVGAPIDLNAVDVIDGYFTVELDFGSNIFDGNDRWLQIGIRAGELEDPNEYEFLLPRVRVAAAPYSLYAKKARNAESAEVALYAGIAAHAYEAEMTDYAESANHADTANQAAAAGHATTADTATTATNSAHANEADHATGADTANTATNAGHAATADSAGSAANADHATTADSASNATNAGSAVHADEADHAATADTATNATNAGHATTADNATSAANSTHADEADHATTAGDADTLDGLHSTSFSLVGHTHDFNDGDWVISDSNVYANVAGNVGIGTTEPSEKLEVDGNVKITGNLVVDGSITPPENSEDKLVHSFVVESGEAIFAGEVVAILNNGRVAKASDHKLDLEDIFLDGTTEWVCATALSETKFVVIYQEMARVGETSGSSITFGPPTPFNEGGTSYTSLVALTDTKVVVAYRDDGDAQRGNARVGVIDGNEISFGSETMFNTRGDFVSASQMTAGKCVVVFWKIWDQDKGSGMAVVGEISGDSIDFDGPKVQFHPHADTFSVTRLSESKFAIAYIDKNAGSRGVAITGQINGNDITMSESGGYYFSEGSVQDCSAVGMSETKLLVAYCDNATSHYGTAVVGEIDGGNIDFGVERRVFNEGATSQISAARSTEKEILIAYRDGDNSSYGTLVTGKIGFKDVDFSPEHVFKEEDTNHIYAAGLTDRRFVIACQLAQGTALVVETGALNIVGIADASAGSDEEIPVVIQGISDKLTDLVPGWLYYSDLDGSLIDERVQTNMSRIGLAISPTRLLLDIER